MNVHYFQHVPFEGLGSIGAWANSCAARTTTTRLFLGEFPPPLDEVDWLIVMGGPMGTHDEQKYPWLTAEKQYIEKAIQAGKVVMGICLGAQLLADVLGARVYPNRHREIGWFPVDKTDEADRSSLFQDFPARLDALHWHGDTFDLPTGAVHAFSSAACLHQAFVFSVRTVGLQFHLEMTRQAAGPLIDNCSHELVEGPYVQTAGEILSDPQRFQASNEVMHALLDRLRDETSC